MNLEKDMASSITGMSQRGSRFYVLILVPPDLIAAYGTPSRCLLLHLFAGAKVHYG